MRLTEEQYRDLVASRQALANGQQAANAKWAVDTNQRNQTRSKYGNVKTTDAQGNVHDSGKEYRHWCELELREKAGEIRNLRRQVPLACVVNGEHICDYQADFMYREGEAVIVEDTKPSDPKFRKTPAYRLFRVKQKLAQALHNFQIREV